MKTRCSVTAYDAKGRAALVSRTTLNGKVETSKFTYNYKSDVASTVHQVVVSGNEGFSAVTTNGYDVKSGKLSSTTEAVSYRGTSASAQVATYRYDGLGRLSQVIRSGRAGISSYGYDLHGWPTSVKSKAFEEVLHYADGYGEPRYGGGISSVEWKNPNYPKLRGYMYYYDALGRLESAVYGENVGLSTNPDRYNETVLEYTENGAIERFQRRGLKQDGQYGKIDNLNITLDGNRVAGVDDDAAPLLYKGALDFTDSTDGGTSEYTYDGDGRLTGDMNRSIAKIDYDAAGNPRRVQYMDGSVTEYVYTAAGEKLRAIHRTAAPNVSVDFGQTKELTASETLNVDSTDYYGSLTAENGEAKIYNFGGGYCTFDGACKFHYFDRDHQGNVRAVVGTAGTVEQIMNYYPFGAPYCDNTTLNPDLQPYKYNGKEFETMHGRNAYDYGARFYDPLLPTWDRMDPLCEKYYHISPYAYCANDPVNFIDVNGLYPEFLMSLNKTPFYRADYYTLNAPASHLLSLITGVPETFIMNARIMERGFGRLYPWYSNDDGGAITLGHSAEKISMTFTPNYFEDDRTKYNGNVFGQDFYAWMDLLSHEVTHINHIMDSGGMLSYVLGFGIDYLKYGHDDTPREKEANVNQRVFNDFSRFTNKNHGKRALERLFKSDLSDNQKISTINRWWNEYKEDEDENEDDF